MKEQFVTYEIAKELKNLGFNCDKFGYYENIINGYQTISEWKKSNLHFYEETENYIFYLGNEIVEDDNCIIAPLWQQVIDWFIKKHDLYVYPFNKAWKIDDLFSCLAFGETINYKEGREIAILKAIEIIKNK